MSIKGDNFEGSAVVAVPNRNGLRSSESREHLISDDSFEAAGSSLDDDTLDTLDFSIPSSHDATRGGMSADVPLSNNNHPGIPSIVTTITKRQCLTMAVLCYVNLINYMDRLTLAGILKDIQENFNISNEMGGLLQTVFVISYMIFAPVFGYLGDRYSRRWIMAFGVFFWSLTTLWGSFTNKSFGWFICSRAMVGIGEASYSTIAPTIISDMFTHKLRSKMLTLFYFAIPVGSGLGYISGSQAVNFTGDWRWALRITPVLGAIAVMLIIFGVVDPPRGESEGTSSLKATSYKEDLKDLTKNKTYMLSTLAFTCVSFVTGALAWWGPTFITLGTKIQEGSTGPEMNVSLIFGAITMLAGLLGVPLGYLLAQKFRPKSSHADPLICAFGLLASAPFLYLALIVVKYNTIACFIFIFFGQLFLNLNWSIIADILLYVVIPTRRATAEAFQILFAHLLGDAGSPYLVGVVSDWLKSVLAGERLVPLTSADTLSILQNATTMSSFSAFENISGGTVEDPVVAFQSLQYSLFITFFVEVLGGMFFLMSVWYIVADKAKCERIIANSAVGEILAVDNEDANDDQGSDNLAYQSPVRPLIRQISLP